MDGIDEYDCPHQALNVLGLKVDPDKVTNHTLLVTWWIPDIGRTAEIEFRASHKVAEAHDGSWIQSEWMKSDNFTYTFTDLLAYTTYNLTVDLREKGKDPIVTRRFVTARTAADKPSAPTLLPPKITYEGGKKGVLLEWTAPSMPNGEIRLACSSHSCFSKVDFFYLSTLSGATSYS